MRKYPPTQNSPFSSLVRLNWRAILTGAIADILLSALMSTGLIAIFIQLNGLSDAGAEVLDSAFRASPFYWMTLVLGILISGLGGFIAGWLAHEEHLLHGLIAAFLTNVILVVLTSSNAPFTIIEFSGSMLGLLLGMGGGWLAGMVKTVKR